MRYLWCEADLAAYKKVVSVTVCAVTGAGKKRVLEACAPDDDHVKLAPVFVSSVDDARTPSVVASYGRRCWLHPSRGKSKTLVEALRGR